MRSKRFLATIVCDVALTKLDALQLVARLCDEPVRDAGSQTPFVITDTSSRAQVEIPKFGEPPPLAIDIWSTESVSHAQSVAHRLCADISAQTGWDCHVDTESK